MAYPSHRLRTAAFGVSLAALAVIAGAVPAQTQTLRWANQGDAVTMDPYGINETFTLGLQGNVYEPLVGYDSALRLKPMLAVAWENPEPTRWVFHLRQGVRFHDGNPFTATDVVFSWRRALSEGSDMKTYAAKATDVRALDDHTVEVTTAVPNPILPREWALLFMMDEEWSRANGATEATNVKGADPANGANLGANGTGPFVLAERLPDVRTRLTRNPDYWDAAIATNLREVVFTPVSQPATRVAALLSGELDLIQPVPVQDWDRLEGTPGVRALTGAEARAVFIGMDQWRDELASSDVRGRNPFKDPRVREAVVRAVDTAAINAKIMRGAAEPLGTLIAPPVAGYDAAFGRPYTADVDKAKALLAEAGYPEGFAVTLDCPNDRYVNDEKICQAVAAMLARVGIRVDLLAQTKGRFFAKVLAQAGYDTAFYLLGWTPATLDAHHTLFNLVACRNPEARTGLFNLGGYCNPEVDALIAAIGTESDGGRRHAQIAEAFALLRRDFGYLPLHAQPLSWGVRDGVTVVQRADDILDLRTVVVE